MAAISFPQSDLLDVNQIVKDLASMVSEQGDVIGGYPQHPASTRPPPRCGQRRGQASSGGAALPPHLLRGPAAPQEARGMGGSPRRGPARSAH